MCCCEHNVFERPNSLVIIKLEPLAVEPEAHRGTGVISNHNCSLIYSVTCLSLPRILLYLSANEWSAPTKEAFPNPQLSPQT